MAATMNVKAKRLLMELKDKESTFAASLGSLEKMVKAAGGEERISFHDRMMIANVRAKLAAIRKAIAEAPNLE